MASARTAVGTCFLVLLAAGCASARPAASRPEAVAAPQPVAPATVVAAGDAAPARERAASDSLWHVGDSLQALEMVRRGHLKMRAGQDSAAARDYGEALRLWPRVAAAHVGLAATFANTGRPLEELAHLDSAAALGDTSLYAINLRGRALARLRRCPEAVSVLAPFVQAHPDWTNPTPDLARCYLRLHRESEAVPLMQAAVRREPESAPLRYALVDVFTASGRPDSALVHARYLADRHPDDGYWWAILARTLFLVNRLEEARAAYERGFQLVLGLLDQLAPIDRSTWETLQQMRRRPPP
jgi:tetratricopeptide (TPR) repeat protein